MKIKNCTNNIVICSTDENAYILNKGETVEVEEFEKIQFSHDSISYSCLEAGKSKLLKFLSFFDDPFNLYKEYHVMVETEVTKKDLCNVKELTVLTEINYIDAETRTFYHYFIMKSDDRQIFPSKINVSGKKEIKKDFENNNKRLTWWKAFWNIVIEPLCLEIIGYIMIYLLFSIWLGKGAWLVVLPLIIVNVLIEALVFIFKLKNKREQRFNNYLNEDVIWKNCYKN